VITACVVDDEPLAVSRLVRMLEKSGRVTVVARTSDPAAASALVSEHSPDVRDLARELPALHGIALQ
jgi:chemotaxis response regulator CheB